MKVKENVTVRKKKKRPHFNSHLFCKDLSVVFCGLFLTFLN